MATKGSDEMHDALDKTRKVFHIIKSTPVNATYDEHYVIGQGEVGPGGGAPGDLYVEIVEIPHEFLIREESNLHISISIPMTSAALGTRVLVDTLDGKQEVEIKEGTQSGSVVVLRGFGVTKLRGSGRGDLIVHIQVLTPTKINKEQSELFKKIASLRSEGLDKVKINTNDEQSFFDKVKRAFR